MTASRVSLCFGRLMLLLAGSAALGAEPPLANDAIEYRRYYVPYDRPQDWPKGDVPYVPIEKDEFERLVAVLQSPQRAALGSAARVSHAAYEGKLVDQDLLSGQARLEIVRQADAPVLLPLDPCGLAIDRVRWDDAESPEALFGLAADGRAAAYVDRSGTLLIDWSLRGHRDATGAVTFALELPRCPLTALELALPPDVTPSSSAGVLLPIADGRWKIELGGQNHCLLKLTPESATQQARPLALLQQLTRYDFSPGGVELTAELTLDVHHEPLQRLELTIDAALQLMSARFGDLDVPWTSASADETPGKRRVVLEFPQPLLGPRQQLQLKALAPLVSDQLCTLPSIQARGVFWQEGTIRLLVPAPLSIDRLTPVGCRESPSASLPSPLSAELAELQAFSPNAAVKVLISRRLPPAELDSAVQVTIGPDRLEGTWIGEFRASRGERLSLSAEVLQGWVIDSVASLPDGDIVDDESSPLDLEGRVLTVHLARALSPDHPIRLRIAAHAVAAPRQRPVRVAELQMLAVDGVAAKERLLAVGPQSPFQLMFEDAEEVPRREASQLTARERQWFDEDLNGAIFDFSSLQGSWTAMLEEQPPRFAAEIDVEATLTQNSLSESYVVRCTPESASINRCLVHFSESRSEPPHFWLAETTTDEVVARRCTPEQELAADLGHGETWELTFNRPHSKPFEFRATRATTADHSAALSLLALPAASTQQGQVKVLVTDASSILIENRRLKPLPLASVAAAEYPVVRGEFRYDPAGEVISSAGPAITVSRPNRSEQLPGAVIWSLRVDSRYEAAGGGAHLATCEIESSGRPRCSLRLPAGAEVQGVWVEDQFIRWTAVGGQLSVPLPAGKRFPVVEVQFTTSGPELSVWQAIEAPWPEADLAVLNRSWRLWSPPEFEVLSLDPMAVGKPALNWSQRLFGILGRPAAEMARQPAYLGGWRAPANGRKDADAAAASPAFEQSNRHSPAFAVWQASAQAGSRAKDNLYWQAYQFEPIDGAPLMVRFIDRTMVLAIAWMTLALTFAVARWLLRGRAPALAGLAGTIAGAGLLGPECLSPIASAALIALLCCLLAELFVPRLSAEAPPAAPSHSSQARLAEALALAIVLAGGGALNLAVGQETALTEKSLQPDRLYRVFIPSDVDGKPVGGRYQIPQSLRSELRRRAMNATGEPHGWLIADAAYSLVLGQNELDSRVDVLDFAVRYQLHVLSANTRVRIPLARERASLAPDSAVLDNQPVEPYWEEGGQALLCDVPDPGEYQLEFKLRPAVTSSVDNNSLELAIPAVPSATVQVRTPQSVGDVEIPGAAGAVSWSESRDVLSAKLGPVSRLTVRWPQTMNGPEPTLEADELLWLKVRPGSVVVDGRIHYHVSGGPVRQLSLKADRRFRYIPPGPESPVAQYRTSPGTNDMADSPQVLQLELSEPINQQLTLPISLLLTETSGVGNIRLPQLELLGARSRRRWLAVSVDSGLEVTVQNDDALERVDAAEFVADWGKTSLQPLLAYRLPPGDAPWSLATRPREPHTTVKQALAVSFERGAAQLHFEAQLMTTAGYCFQHRLLAPKNVAIESVSLIAEGAERVQRWAIDDDGMLNVFLASRTTGSQKLSLRASLSTPAAGMFPLPVIRIEGADPLPQGDVVQIFRRPTALVSVEDRRAAAEVAQPQWDELPAQFGRPIAAFAALTRDFSAQVLLAPNEPLVDCVQVTSLEYEDQVWTAEIEHRLNIERGVIDVLRFDIPAGWNGPFEATPPATVETIAEPAQGRRRLLVRPRTELKKGQHRIVIRAPLAFSDNTQVMVPDIRPLQSRSEERYVVLPTQVGLEQVTWDTTRLAPAELPAGFSTPFVSAEAFQAYRIVGERPQAVLNAVERSADMARVRLADYQLSWQPDGIARLTASFDIEPTGLSACPLRLPPEWRLVQASVAGIPVTPAAAGDGWKLPLAANRMPQRVRITAQGPAGEPARFWTSMDLPAPGLGDMPVEQALWTLRPPSGWRCVAPERTATFIDGMECERYRLQSIDAIVGNLSDDTAATTPPIELEQWRRTWARRLALLKIDIDRRTRSAGEPIADAELPQSLQREWRRIIKDLKLDALVQQLIQDQPLRDQSAELWEQSQAAGDSAIHFVVHRGGTAPRIRLVRFGQSGFLSRLGGVAAIALATLLSMLALRSGIVVEFLRRWPSTAGVAVGIAWWLWLSPSSIGWLLVLASLAAAFRRPWRSLPEPRSGIVPVGSVKG